MLAVFCCTSSTDADNLVSVKKKINLLEWLFDVNIKPIAKSVKTKLSNLGAKIQILSELNCMHRCMQIIPLQVAYPITSRKLLFFLNL